MNMIIGWVAVTGEHQWIFTGEHDVTSYSTLNPCNDAWQAQFAAGIKTNVVAAVFPHGVVQFGSLNAVKENVRFLAHIRDVFSANQESVCQTRLRCNPVSSICRKRVLTWEDGYYNNQNEADQSESKNFNETLDGLQNGHVTHDSLALDVAKMSYHVYSLGEGIVGRVAVTREHQWIFTGEHDVTSYSTLNPCDDAWQAQFAAGIKTIVVAAVFPHGVIQFGSLNAVKENVRFLAHNRDVFSANQESVCQIQTPLQSSLQHMSQTSVDISSGVLTPDLFQDYLLDKAANKEHIFPDSAKIPTLQKHLNYSGILMSGVDSNYSNSYMIRNEGTNRQISYSSQSHITENSSLYNGKQKVDNHM